MILNGFDDEEIADAVGVSVSSVRNWRRKLKKHDEQLHVLSRETGSGYSSKLTDEQKHKVKEIVLAGAQAFGFPDERWTGTRVAAMIQQTFDIEYSRSAATELLHTLGLSPQMPVVKSHKHSEEEVFRWAKQEWNRIKKSEKTRHTHSIIG